MLSRPGNSIIDVHTGISSNVVEWFEGDIVKNAALFLVANITESKSSSVDWTTPSNQNTLTNTVSWYTNVNAKVVVPFDYGTFETSYNSSNLVLRISVEGSTLRDIAMTACEVSGVEYWEDEKYLPFMNSSTPGIDWTVDLGDDPGDATKGVQKSSFMSLDINFDLYASFEFNIRAKISKPEDSE